MQLRIFSILLKVSKNSFYIITNIFNITSCNTVINKVKDFLRYLFKRINLKVNLTDYFTLYDLYIVKLNIHSLLEITEYIRE